MRELKHTWRKKALYAYGDEGLIATEEEVRERAYKMEMDYLKDWQRENKDKVKEYSRKWWTKKWIEQAEENGIDYSDMTQEEIEEQGRKLKIKYISDCRRKRMERARLETGNDES